MSLHVNNLLMGSETGLRYAFLLGRGRSGTTWIGQILNRYAGCHYKYEPFNRDKPAAYRRWLVDLPHGDDADLHRRFDALMRGCDAQRRLPRRSSSSPTVVSPSPASPRVADRRRSCRLLRSLYERYGRPSYRPGDWALIKQVNFPNEHLHRLDAVLEPHMLAIVRNPFASVPSMFRFSAGGAERAAAHRCLGGPCRRAAPPSVARFGVPQPFQLTSSGECPRPPSRRSRWRIQSEPLAEFAPKFAARAAYEPRGFRRRSGDLPYDGAYAFFGWPFRRRESRSSSRHTTRREEPARRLGPRSASTASIAIRSTRWRR